MGEVTNLRKKYDELVAFSVNLTAERDILNNTLEQTKRELDRELAQRSAIENKGAGGAGDGSMDSSSGKSASSGAPKKNSFVGMLLQILVISLAGFLGGIRMKNYGTVDFLDTLPVLGEYLTPPTISDVVKEETANSIEVESSEEEPSNEEDGVDEDTPGSDTE